MSIKKTGSPSGVFTNALNNEETQSTAAEGSEAYSSLAGYTEAQENIVTSLLSQLKGLKGGSSGLFMGPDYLKSSVGELDTTALNVTDERHDHHKGFSRLIADCLKLQKGRLSLEDHEQITGINGREMGEC